MIEIDDIRTFGWKGAITGIRNSWESWEQSDTEYGDYSGYEIVLGPKDLALTSKLAKAGGSESKFRRCIHIQFNMIAPIYWLKQFDTYKIGVTSLSNSTMHTLTKREISIDNFSCTSGDIMSAQAGLCMMNTVSTLNELRKLYLETENPTYKEMYWQDIIHLLPESYNQYRTIDMNYEAMSHMVHDRIHHKLPEWKDFCRIMMEKLPYSKELIYSEEGSKDADN